MKIQHEFETGKNRLALDNIVEGPKRAPVKFSLLGKAERLFITPDQYPTLDTKQYIARLLLHAIVVLFPPLLGFLALFLAVGAENFEPGPRTIAVIAAVSIIAWFSATLALIRIGRPFLARVIFVFCSTIFCLAIVQITGGVFHSVATPFIIVPPLIGYYFYGHQNGSKIALALLPLSYGLDQLNHILGNPIPDTTSLANPYLNEIIANVAVYIVLSVTLYAMLKAITTMRKKMISQRTKLEILANRDELTSILNSRHFYDQLEELCEQADQTDQKLAVIFVDLDEFKAINDEHGHRTGDEVLIEVARRIRTFCKDGDCAARLGGDEFALILNRIKDDQAATKLIKSIKSLLQVPMKIDDIRISMSASIGYCIYRDQTFDRTHLVGQADVGMYQDKQERRRARIVS